jgi:hypothetical protein
LVLEKVKILSLLLGHFCFVCASYIYAKTILHLNVGEQCKDIHIDASRLAKYPCTFTSIGASILNILVKSLCNRACVLTAQQIPYIPESVSLNKLFPEDCLDCTTGDHGQ